MQAKSPRSIVDFLRSFVLLNQFYMVREVNLREQVDGKDLAIDSGDYHACVLVTLAV